MYLTLRLRGMELRQFDLDFVREEFILGMQAHIGVPGATVAVLAVRRALYSISDLREKKVMKVRSKGGYHCNKVVSKKAVMKHMLKKKAMK